MRRNLLALISILFIITSIVGLGFSYLNEQISINEKSERQSYAIELITSIEGAYTHPHTGEKIQNPTRIVSIASSFPTRFKYRVLVVNTENTELTRIVVTDTFSSELYPTRWTAQDGIVVWNDKNGVDRYSENELIWLIVDLGPGESTWIEVELQTIQSEIRIYQPSRGDDKDSQEIKVNEGAHVKAESAQKTITTHTNQLVIKIRDNGTPGDGLGVLSPPLPLSSQLARVRYP